MTSKNKEDYLRSIYELQTKAGGSVKAGAIASKLGISKPSVSEMMGKLKNDGLVESAPYGAVSLTGKGVEEARKILRRHRLLEVFFSDFLGINAFHDEAHETEHALSEEAERRLEKLLKHPKKCPDGDEIPRRGAKVLPLARAPKGKPLRVLFSTLENEEELASIKALGIIHGEKARVLKKINRGPLILLVKGAEIAIGADVSSNIYVEVGG